jgi:hypothetical protein
MIAPPARSLAVLAACFAVFLAVGSGSAADRPEWQGDFEDGSLGQWDSAQSMGQDRISVEQGLVRQGRYAARFQVRPGDVWGGVAGGERAEVLKGVEEAAGRESYWSWSTYFPASFVSDQRAGFQMFTQWHSTSSTNKSGVTFQVVGDRLAVRVAGGATPDRWQQYDLGPLVRGSWQDFVVHVRWGSDQTGFLEVWRDGQAVVQHANAPNIGIGLGTYVKQGFYRPSEPYTTVVYHDGMRYGTTAADVTAPFTLSLVGKLHLAKGRLWLHLRSFASTRVALTLTTGGETTTRTVTTNRDGDVWSSIACGSGCAGPGAGAVLRAQAAVDSHLPASTRSAAWRLRRGQTASCTGRGCHTP